MSELKDVITSYNNLSFSDRIVFYTTISNDIAISDDTQSFLIETRLDGEGSCIYCEGMHVVSPVLIPSPPAQESPFLFGRHT